MTRKWQDIEYREKVTAAISKSRENLEVARKGSVKMKSYYKEHPEKKEEIGQNVKEYLSKPENRKFVDSDSHLKPVICVETGEYFPSQMAAEIATGYSGIHKVCAGIRHTSGGDHWRYA